jgi:hypothetical protein
MMNKLDLEKIRKDRAEIADISIEEAEMIIAEERKSIAQAERIIEEANERISEAERLRKQAQIIKDSSENPSIIVMDGLANVDYILPYTIRPYNKNFVLYRHHKENLQRYDWMDLIVAAIIDKAIDVAGVRCIDLLDDDRNVIRVHTGYLFTREEVRKGMEKILKSMGFSVTYKVIYPGGDSIGERMGEHVAAITGRNGTTFHTNFEILKSKKYYFHKDEDANEFEPDSITVRILNELWKIPALVECRMESYELQFEIEMDDAIIRRVADILEKEISRKISKKKRNN